MKHNAPQYCVQGLYANGTIQTEYSVSGRLKAIRAAKELARSPYFEADYTQVLTQDSELVWTSWGKKRGGQ